MRIAMIGQKGIPSIYGGIERHVEDLSIELTKQGHEVLAYARAWYTPKALKNYRGVRIIHTKSIHSKHLDAITGTLTATLDALFRQVDVFHFHGVGPALLSFIPRLFAPRAKVIVTFHCIDRYHQKWGWLGKIALWLGGKAACTFPHQTIAVSKTIQNYCINEHGQNTEFIPNGAPKTQPTSDRLLTEFGLKKDKYVLMVARLVRHKGAHYLINAWQNARAQNKDLKDYKLAIVGGSTFTDDYQKELKRLARGDKSIVFTGWQNGTALEELYANSALYVNPSENEGLPISVLQAMSYGRPVLLSNIPEHMEIIEDRNFLFENTDVKSLTEKILELIKDNKKRGVAGKKNATTIVKKYNWNKLSVETQKVYADGEKMKLAKLKTRQV